MIRRIAEVAIGGVVAGAFMIAAFACGDEAADGSGGTVGGDGSPGTDTSSGSSSGTSSGSSSGASGSSSGGAGDAAIDADAACTPNVVACNGKRVERCETNGVLVVEKTCVADCVTSPTPHCPTLEPKYVGSVCEGVAPTTALDTTGPTTLDTSMDANCTSVLTQVNGPDVCVVAKTSITIGAGTFTVTGARALALVAVTGDVTVTGTVDVGATNEVSGPGGGTIASGAASTASAGGGGAGFGTAGAAGGDTATGNGGAAGAAIDPLTLGVLLGGARADTGAGISGVKGGGGGGALTFVSCRGTVSAPGTIDARGGGGRGQRDTILGGGNSQSHAGAGGGAGGYVVFQGLDVRVTGAVYANGGGGGGGNTADDGTGAPGEDGTRSVTIAAKGGLGSGVGANGGNGGIVGAAPAGGGGSVSGTNGGGGGGARGRFQIYTPNSVAPTVTPTAASPAFESNLTLPTH